MEGRRVLRHLTVEQNLFVGGLWRSRAARRARVSMRFTGDRRLAALKDRVTGYLFGGEQQMVVIGRAMMANPS